MVLPNRNPVPHPPKPHIHLHNKPISGYKLRKKVQNAIVLNVMQVKSEDRVRNHSEVLTNECEVYAMFELV